MLKNSDRKKELVSHGGGLSSRALVLKKSGLKKEVVSHCDGHFSRALTLCYFQSKSNCIGSV